MSEHVREQLSACLDGELPEQEWALLSRRLSSDREWVRTVGRYALIGEAMRGTLCGDALRGDLAGRVSRALDAPEPAASRGGAAHWQRSLGRLLAGGGIAAAVAVVALVTLQGGSRGPGPVAGGELPQASAPTPASYTVPEPPDRMTSYLVRHGNYAHMVRNSSWTRVLAQEPSAGQAAESGAAGGTGVEPDGQTRQAPADRP